MSKNLAELLMMSNPEIFEQVWMAKFPLKEYGPLSYDDWPQEAPNATPTESPNDPEPAQVVRDP
jgi:hypothetical protein